jgi:uncharacterized repeat protein (TIGR01451 family)
MSDNHRSRRLLAAITVLASVAFSVVISTSPAVAATIQPFTPRFHRSTNGAIDIVGNSQLTCPATATNCEAVQAGTASSTNNNFSMITVDTDTDPATTNSTSATLTIPSSATISFAGLYWGAMSTDPARTSVLLRVPGATGPVNVTADQITTSSSNYSAFADVTALVNGGGEYTVADMAVTTGANKYAGWSLVVAWEHPSEPLRDLTVFDGFSAVSNTANDRVVNVAVSGFTAPPFGQVNVEVGAVSFEGDGSTVGDQLWLDTSPDTDSTPDGTRLSNPTPTGGDGTNDFFNSTISDHGQIVTARTPAYRNTLGFDVDQMDVAGIIPNSATSVGLTATTTGDAYFLQALTFAIDLYAPSFPAVTKSVTNLTHLNGPTVPGDVLEYTLGVTNVGSDSADGVVIVDPLPAGVSYLPGSLTAGTAGATSPVSDAAGDDIAEMVAGQVVFRAGTSGDATTGGTLVPGGSAALSFKVTVDPAASGSIANRFVLKYTAHTLGRQLEYVSNDASVTVAATADLAVTHTASVDPATVGAPFIYTVTVTNNGPSTATSVTLTNTFNPMIVTGPITASQGTCTATGCDLGNLAPGATATIQYTVTPGAGLHAGDRIDAVATVTTTTLDPEPRNDSAVAITAITETADLSVTKVLVGNGVVAGDRSTWELTVTNHGPSTARSVTVTDQPTSPLELVSMTAPGAQCDPTVGHRSCELGDLPAGTSTTVTVEAAADPATAAGHTITNEATVQSVTADNNTVNNTSTVKTQAATIADLAVTKVLRSDDLVAGSPATWEVTVTNNGPSDAAAVAVTDTMPDGVTWLSSSSTVGSCEPDTPACTIDVLPVHASTVITFTGTVEATVTRSTITNAATASSSTTDPDTGNNTGTIESTVARRADLAVTVRATSADGGAWLAGTPGEFRMEITNHGPSLSGLFTLTDSIPAGASFVRFLNTGTLTCSHDAGTVTCSGGPLPVGGNVEVVAEVFLAADVDPAGLETVASVTQTDVTDPMIDNNSATASLPTAFAADLEIVKVPATGPVTAGTAAGWTITVTNHGPSTAQTVRVTDLLPAGLTVVGDLPAGCSPADGAVVCDLGSVAPGVSVSVVVGTVVGADVAPGDVTNSASVTSATTDPALSNNKGSGTVAVTAVADLGLVKSGPSRVVAGGLADWVLAVSNAGPSDASGVVVTDVLPAGLSFVAAGSDPRCVAAGRVVTCAAGDLAAGGVGSLSIRTLLDPDFAAGSVGNDAAVSSSTPDTDQADNTASAVAAVSTSADLVVSKTAVNSFVPGRFGVWEIAVSNTGPSTAHQVVVTDALPPGFTATAALSAIGDCEITALSVVCAPVDLPAGGQLSVMVVGRIDPAAVGSMVNRVSVSSSTVERDGSNNTAVAEVVLQPSADLALSKTASVQQVTNGERFSWTLVVTNRGPSAADAVVLEDRLPAGVSVAGVPAGCVVDGGVVRCQLGVVPVGGRATVVVDVVARSDGDAVNTATVRAATFDPSPAAASSTVGVVPVSTVVLAKSTAATTAVIGDVVVWTVSLRDVGPSTARGLVVAERMPATLKLVGAEPGCGVWDPVSLEWRVPAVDPGVTCELVVSTMVLAAGPVSNSVALVGSDSPVVLGDGSGADGSGANGSGRDGLVGGTAGSGASAGVLGDPGAVGSGSASVVPVAAGLVVVASHATGPRGVTPLTGGDVGFELRVGMLCVALGLMLLAGTRRKLQGS